MVGASSQPVAPTLVASERRLVRGDAQAEDAAQQRQRLEHINYVRQAHVSAQICGNTSKNITECSAAVLLSHQSFHLRGVASRSCREVAGSNRWGGGGGLIGLQRLLRLLRLLRLCAFCAFCAFSPVCRMRRARCQSFCRRDSSRPRCHRPCLCIPHQR